MSCKHGACVALDCAQEFVSNAHRQPLTVSAALKMGGLQGESERHTVLVRLSAQLPLRRLCLDGLAVLLCCTYATESNPEDRGSCCSGEGRNRLCLG